MNTFAPLAAAAVKMVETGTVVGLGSGRTATAFVKTLGTRVKEGLAIRGVATSQATADLAARLGIPLVSLDDVEAIDVTFDGADEVDPRLDLIKGRGGAMVREKIVASASRRLVILVSAEKLVATLGEHGDLPLEVVPFALAWCRRRIAALGYEATPRERNGQLILSDNGNAIVDCRVGPLTDPAGLELALRAIPGVVGTGLFLGMAKTVLVQEGGQVKNLSRKGRA